MIYILSNYIMKQQLLFLLIIIIFACLSHNTLKEGFESYDNCIEQLYPRDFCLHLPIQAVEEQVNYVF